MDAQLNHGQAQALYLDALDGALPAEDSRRFETHLTGCDECRVGFQSYLAMVHRVRALPACLVVVLGGTAAACSGVERPPEAPAWLDAYRPIAAKLIAESRASDFAWRRLAEVTDTFGPRLSGTANLEMAIDWAVASSCWAENSSA